MDHLYENPKSCHNEFQKKYLSSYIDHHTCEYPNDDYGRDMIRQDVARINSNLDALGMHRLGDMFNGAVAEADKTLSVVREFLDRRQKELEYKNQMAFKIKKLETEREELANQKDKWIHQRQSLEQDRERLIKKAKDVDSAYKESINRLTQDRDDLAKQLAKSQGKQNQFRNQLKKRDNTINQLQESIKKMQGDKSIPYKNSFEVTSSLQQTGPFLYYANAEHEYGQLIQKNFEQSYEKLTNQNRYYRQCLSNIYRELNDILEFRKDILMRRRGLDGDDSGDISSLNLTSFKSQLLNMPMQNSKQAVDMLDDNIKRFREYMDRMDMTSIDQMRGCSEGDMEKLKTVKNVKGLIKRYKHIVETQDEMLGRMVLKAKDLKLNQLPDKARVMDDHELEKAKKFLEQQKGYLEAKNKEIQSTKKAMAASLKRVEEEKAEMMRKRRQIEEQGIKLKKNLELLPTQLDDK